MLGLTDAEPRPVRMLRLAQVLEVTGIGSKSTLYRMIQAGEFPQGERLSHRCVVWPETSIGAWQRARFALRLEDLL